MNDREKFEHRRRYIVLLAWAMIPAAYAIVLLVILAARYWKLFALLTVAGALACCSGCNEEHSKKIDPPAQVLTEDEAGRALRKQFNGL